MFDGEETTAAVLLITDGSEIFAIPVQRTGDLTWENKLTKVVQLDRRARVSEALAIPGAETE